MVAYNTFHEPTDGNAMKQFIRKFADRLVGVLSGFDRLRFRGTLLLLTSEGGMCEFMRQNNVLLKDFKSFVLGITARVRAASARLAAHTPHGKIEYLSSTSVSKEQVAREMAEHHGVREGLVCVLSCIEPCRSTRWRRATPACWKRSIAASSPSTASATPTCDGCCFPAWLPRIPSSAAASPAR